MWWNKSILGSPESALKRKTSQRERAEVGVSKSIIREINKLYLLPCIIDALLAAAVIII